MKSYAEIKLFISDDVTFSCKDLDNMCDDFEKVTDIILGVNVFGLCFEGVTYHKLFRDKDLRMFEERWRHLLLSMRVKMYLLHEETRTMDYYQVVHHG